MIGTKLAFVLQQYVLLGAFAVAAYGLGRPLIGWMQMPHQLSPLLSVPLQISAGLGIMMISLFIAGSAGSLGAPVVLTLLLVGSAQALASLAWGPAPLRSIAVTLRAMGRRLRRVPLGVWWWVAVLTLVAIPLVLAPLSPPTYWDELAYHLPYARFWAEQGALTVSPWLRYPLGPYNLNLLYAAALIVGSDVLPHLLHGLTAALTALLTLGLARRFMDGRVGAIAAILVLYTTRWGWSNAYVDMGLTLFWSAAFAALALRHAEGDERFSLMAAFFAGIAVGIKYQGLFYLPAFVLLALAVERRPAAVARAATIFILVGSYWYLRNYWISGDPVHPIGGRLFGFWLWDSGDLAGQYGDLNRVRGWHDWVFLPALAAPFLWRGASTFQRGVLLCTLATLVSWYLVSGYWRYALPIYPMLALLTGWVLAASKPASLVAARLRPLGKRVGARARRTIASLVLLAVAAAIAGDIAKAWGRVLPPGTDRVAFLAKRFGGFALLHSLPGPAISPLYQLGFENELYYLGDSVRGDWFGPGRYHEVLALTEDGGALARHLRGLGAEGLLVNRAREPFSTQPWDPQLLDYFELVAQSERAVLYRLQAASPDADGGPRPGLPGSSDQNPGN